MKNNVQTAIQKRRPGGFARVSYKAPVELTAAAARSGVSIYEIVTTTVHLNVTYSKIASVIARRAAEPDTVRAHEGTWWRWEDGAERCIAVHKTNGTRYAAFYPLRKGDNTEIRYEMDGKPVDIDTVRKYARPSYFNKSYTEIKFVKEENVISIGDDN